MGDHRSQSSSSEPVPTARTSQRGFFDVARTSASCCWTPAVCWYRSTCKISAEWALTRPPRFRRPVILVSLAPSCGACHGAVMSTFPVWRTAPAESQSTGRMEPTAHAARSPAVADHCGRVPRPQLLVESESGVVPATDFIFGELHDELFPRVVAATPSVPNIETAIGDNGVEIAPLAVQGSSPVSGLFSFDKFSSLPVLIDAIREDVMNSGTNDANRRLFFVPRAHVTRLHASSGNVQAVEVDVAGQRQFLGVAPNCAVILAASGVESTRLALNSFHTALMGRNLMAHLRSDFTVRIQRSALRQLPGHVQTAAMLVRGAAPSGRFHLQVTASTSRSGSDDLLFRMIPDIDQLNQHLANTDPDWISLTLRGIAEMRGDKTSPIRNSNGSWINLGPWESDEFGVPRAYVQILTASSDIQTWQAMDEAAVSLAQAIAGSPAQIQYHYDGSWQTSPFPLSRPFPEWHRGLGTTYHESSTLWMGDDPATSVTDTSGPFHHIQNAYVCDQSVFPTVGSVNPVLTGLTLAKRLVEQLPP
jgi:GMC oxidoreductase